MTIRQDMPDASTAYVARLALLDVATDDVWDQVRAFRASSAAPDRDAGVMDILKTAVSGLPRGAREGALYLLAVEAFGAGLLVERPPGWSSWKDQDR